VAGRRRLVRIGLLDPHRQAWMQHPVATRSARPGRDGRLWAVS
jgi:hypothetical protein